MIFLVAPPEYSDFLESLNYDFNLVFLGEFCVKFIGLGASQYFRSGWNRFDFFVLVLSWIEVLIKDSFSLNIALFRVLRAMRVLRLMRHNKGIQKVIRTVRFVYTSLRDVGLVLFLVLFVYSLMGIQLFRGVVYQKYLNELNNFDSFGVSFLTMFMATTGENWNFIMRELMVEVPFCSLELNNCGHKIAAPLFFVTFQLLSFYLVVNIFVAVIVNAMEEDDNDEEAFIPLADITKFAEVWGSVAIEDDECLVKLDVFMSTLLPLLPPAWKEFFPYEKRKDRWSAVKELDHENLPQYDGCLHYLDVIMLLIRRKLKLEEDGGAHGIPASNQLLGMIRAEVASQFPLLVRSKGAIVLKGHQISLDATAAEEYSAGRIQRFIRARIIRRQERKKLGLSFPQRSVTVRKKKL